MKTEEAMDFIREREEKLGAPILFKAYATWFAEVGRERREFGVFLYSDGRTLVIEDFFRPGKVLGYELGTKREEERRKAYVKLEISLPLTEVTLVDKVSRPSVEASLRAMEDRAKESSVLSTIFTKNCTRVKTGDRTFYLELPSHKEFKTFMETHIGESK